MMDDIYVVRVRFIFTTIFDLSSTFTSQCISTLLQSCIEQDRNRDHCAYGSTDENLAENLL